MSTQTGNRNGKKCSLAKQDFFKKPKKSSFAKHGKLFFSYVRVNGFQLSNITFEVKIVPQKLFGNVDKYYTNVVATKS